MNSILLILLALTLVVLAVLVLCLQSLQAAAQRKADERAVAHLESWRRSDIALVREQAADVARGQALVELDAWKSEFEKAVRRDAIRRSELVVRGKVTEHFVPYFPDFEFNPKDARFLGSPVDFVVFDGLSEGVVREVIFIEVKTGRSTLTARERQVRNAVEAGSVRWLELRPELGMVRDDEALV